jgi:outer membrane protein assembly factor BamB
MVVAAIFALSLLPSSAAPVQQPPAKLAAANGSWPVYHHDDGQTGYDSTIPPLSSVSTGWVSPVMDAEVFASPLVHNGLVYAATLNNSVYAFNQSTGATVWARNLGTPQTTGWLCGNVSPMGILGTPVIDTAANRIYVTTLFADGIYRVWGLDLTTGNTVLQTAIPTTIGTGFNWTIQQQRGALALRNGYVYVPFGGRAGDCGAYHGWVVGVPTNGSTSLAVYETPNQGIGIWAAGGVTVDDATGNVFVATGNGTGNGCATANQNDAVVRLSPTLALQDYFMPPDWQAHWCLNDQDLGSASPVLISPNLMFSSGKWGGGFLLNPNSLGGVGGQRFPPPSPSPYTQADVCFGNTSNATFGSFAYAAPFLYLECEGRGLVALHINTSTPSFSPCDAACAAPSWHAGSGLTFGPPIVAGGAVWAATNGGGLYAYNVSTGAQIFHSANFGINRFVTPAEAGGQVFVPSHTVIRSFTMAFAFTMESLGGYLTTGPASSSWGATRSDVFVGGSDLGLWGSSWNGTAWSSWSSMGGRLTADPTATSLATNRIDVFVRGTDNGLWHMWWDGTRWNGWEPLGGQLTSAPGASTQGASWIDIVARGTDNSLIHRWWDSAGWHSWESLGGIITADPSSVSWAPGRLDIVVRGTDNGLWQRSWASATGWSNWNSLGGYITSAPSVSSCASGKLDVFALGTDRGLWRLSYSAGAWGTWQSFGGQWTSRPEATCRPGTSTTDVYVRGVDNSLWHLGF